MSKKIKVIVFDFDGVIVDSTKLKHEAWFSFFPKEDVHANLAAAKVLGTLWHESRYNIFRAILKEMQTPEDKIETFVASHALEYGKRVDSAIIEKGFMPGAFDVITKLYEQYPLYINSGTPEKPLITLVQHLGIDRYFKGICGRPVIGSTKIIDSKKENFKKIMKKEGAEGNELVLIGDGDADKESAEYIGCHFIGVANEMNQWSVSKSTFPVIENLLGLEEIIHKINA